VSGGISALVLDDQEFASIGGEARLSSGSALGDTPRYAVEIGGGASALQIVPRAAP
jgi:predicted nucleotidyltransferase